MCGQGGQEKLSFIYFCWTKAGDGDWLVLPTCDFGLGAGMCSEDLYKKNTLKKVHTFHPVYYANTLIYTSFYLAHFHVEKTRLLTAPQTLSD